jgi:transposase
MLEQEEEEQEEEERVRGEQLQHVMQTDPDPCVRRRAQALLLVEEGHTQAGVARLFAHVRLTASMSGRSAFAARGAKGSQTARVVGAHPNSAQMSGPVSRRCWTAGRRRMTCPTWSGLVWTLRDLHALLQRERGIAVSVVTVHRVVHALDLRSRRPRHALSQRQDLAAVAAAKQVLDWLQKNSC